MTQIKSRKEGGGKGRRKGREEGDGDGEGGRGGGEEGCGEGDERGRGEANGDGGGEGGVGRWGGESKMVSGKLTFLFFTFLEMVRNDGASYEGAVMSFTNLFIFFLSYFELIPLICAGFILLYIIFISVCRP